jgi:hypothetical protein
LADGAAGKRKLRPNPKGTLSGRKILKKSVKKASFAYLLHKTPRFVTANAIFFP